MNEKIEKKKSRGFFNKLFVSKAHSDCCNVQFEEVSEDNRLNEKEKKDNLENKKKKAHSDCCNVQFEEINKED